MNTEKYKVLLGRIVIIDNKTCLVEETKKQKFRDKGMYLYLWDLTNNRFLSNIFFDKETSLQYIYKFDIIDFINKRKDYYIIYLNKKDQTLEIEKLLIHKELTDNDYLNKVKSMLEKSGKLERRFKEIEIINP